MGLWQRFKDWSAKQEEPPHNDLFDVVLFTFGAGVIFGFATQLSGGNPITAICLELGTMLMAVMIYGAYKKILTAGKFTYEFPQYKLVEKTK